MAKDIRTSQYKRLKSKILNNRKAKYAFDDVLSNVAKSLLPQAAAPKNQPQQNANNQNINKLQNTFNKKLAQVQKDSDKALQSMSESNDKKLESLREQSRQQNEQNLHISKSLQEAIQKISQQRSSASTQQRTPVEENDTPLDGYPQTTTPRKTTTTPYQPLEDIVTEKKIEEEAVKNLLSKGQRIKVGDHTFRISNYFGERTGDNAVEGRTGHSRGVDVVTEDAQGNITNIPVAVADGVIKSVSLQGDGSTMHPRDGSAGGYMMNVELDDGRIVRYMHLSPDIEKVRSSLIGKKIKRGDVLFEGDHSKWSGSGTANHMKISITNVDDKGNMILDYDDPANDPSPFILN